MRSLLKIFLTLVCLIWSVCGAIAEVPRVSLITCSEGRQIYELEGHTALRIQHPDIGDIIVNWGVFDFDSPNFVYRFVKGETDYIAAGCFTPQFLASYRRHGRTVREQNLALDSVQAWRLVDLAMDNLRPENRVYRYNYVLDNCATRPLALIEAALGDTLTLGDTGLSVENASTFRNVMRYYHRNYPWYQFGIDTALGSGIDRPISAREATFAPVVLERMLEDAKMASGEPIVTGGGYIVGDIDTPPASEGPTSWWLTPMAVALLVLAIAIWASVMQLAGRAAPGRWFDTVFFGVTAIEGVLLTFLIFVSVHEATSPNWLYLWLNPLALLGALAPWLKSPKRLEIIYQSVNFVLLIALAVIFIAGVQSPNPAFIPLMAASALRSAANIYVCRNTKTSH